MERCKIVGGGRGDTEAGTHSKKKERFIMDTIRLRIRLL